MLDTVVLRSPSISEELAQEVHRHLRTRLGVYNADGTVEYEFVSGSLPGSFASSIAVNVVRQEWVSTPRLGGRGHDVAPRECEPFLKIEGSVHKALLGHNVEGGPLDVAAASKWFIADVARRLELELPAPNDWCYDRADWAEAFDLGDYAICEAYIHALGLARYPRRKPRRYGDECVFFPGTTTAFKVYHKGPEFSKHGYRTIAGSVEGAVSLSQQLQARANSLLRFESSIKAKKLIADHDGQRPRVGQLVASYLERVHERETLRVVREGKAAMETVRKNTDVSRRLYEVYEQRLAGVLYGTWLQLSALGEGEVRSRLARPTFYRQRKQLQDAGISWNGSDVVIRESIIPADFSPVRSDRRRLSAEDPRITAALAQYVA